MSWQVLVALSIVLLSAGTLIQRVLLHNSKADDKAFVIIFQVFCGLGIIVYASIFGGFTLPNAGTLWPLMVLTELCFAVGNILYAKTLKILQASIFAVVFATNAVWVMLMGVLFLDESISWQHGIGTLLIFSSVALVASQGEGLKFKLDKGLTYGLATGFVIGLAVSLWVYVSRDTDPVSWTGVSFLVPGLILSAIYPQAVPKVKKLLLNKDILKKFIIMCALIGGSQVMVIQAFNMGEASTIAPLLQTGIFTTTLFAIIFLHERDHLVGKFLAALVCFAGVALIV